MATPHRILSQNSPPDRMERRHSEFIRKNACPVYREDVENKDNETLDANGGIWELLVPAQNSEAMGRVAISATHRSVRTWVSFAPGRRSLVACRRVNITSAAYI
jgi:hypothetical protein